MSEDRGGAIAAPAARVEVPESSARPYAWVGGWAAPALMTVLVLVTIAYFLFHPVSDLSPMGLALLLLLAGSALLSLVLHVYHRRVLTQLHRNILNAKEGILEPLALDGHAVGYLGNVAGDYNEMVTILRAMFTTVEECQNRVIDERNRINALLQSLPGALLNVDDNLTIHSVNRQAVDLMGVDAERLVGSNLFDVLRLDEQYRELLRDVFLYKRSLSNHDVVVDIGGRERWLSFNLSFLNESEADMGAVIVMQDVTDYRQLQDTVSQREKFVAMGQVAGGVAHELNTPLGNILGYAQLLGTRGADAQKQAHYIGVITDEARRCSRIVSDLLSFARGDKCDGDTCDINQMVQEVVESFISCRLRRHRIELTLELAPGALPIEGSCGELEIVLTNLLLNAIQALGETDGARIVVSTESVGDGTVLLAVADNGPGVARELRQRIFEPFFTTKDVGSGSGLGLSITQAMLDKRGASIGLDAEYTGGARFVVRLPAYVEAALND